MIRVGFRRHELPDTHALSAAARDALSLHRRELEQAMRPAGVSAASQRIARLFQMFPLIATGENVAKLVENYTKAVERAPIWAIDAACVQIQRSGADYRPSEPKFVALVTEAVQPAAADLLQISDLLNADIYHVPDPSERERVSARFRALVGEVGLGAPDERREPRRPAVDLAAPLVVSDALRASNEARKRYLDEDSAA